MALTKSQGENDVRSELLFWIAQSEPEHDLNIAYYDLLYMWNECKEDIVQSNGGWEEQKILSYRWVLQDGTSGRGSLCGCIRRTAPQEP